MPGFVAHKRQGWHFSKRHELVKARRARGNQPAVEHNMNGPR